MPIQKKRKKRKKWTQCVRFLNVRYSGDKFQKLRTTYSDTKINYQLFQKLTLIEMMNLSFNHYSNKNIFLNSFCSLSIKILTSLILCASWMAWKNEFVVFCIQFWYFSFSDRKDAYQVHPNGSRHKKVHLLCCFCILCLAVLSKKCLAVLSSTLKLLSWFMMLLSYILFLKIEKGFKRMGTEQLFLFLWP